MRCLVLASFDSFQNAALLVGEHFKRAGCTVDYAGVGGRNASGISSVPGTSGNVWSPTIRLSGRGSLETIAGYDIIVASLDGTSVRQLRLLMTEFRGQRPVVVALFPGLLLRHMYDSFTTRAWCDLLWLNCRRDVAAYRTMCSAYDFDSSNARLFGVAPLLRKIVRTDYTEPGTVVFFEQSVIPSSRLERLYLGEQLVALADRCGTRQFFIKPRAAPGTISLHRSELSIEDAVLRALKRRGRTPTSIEFTYRPVASLLEAASHCLTINSTVAAEALNAGIPTTLISDFGAHDDYGMSYFFGSGLLRSFEGLDLDMPSPICSREWYEEHIANPRETIALLIQEAIELAQNPARHSSAKTSPADISQNLYTYLLSEIGDPAIARRLHKSGKSNWLKKVVSKLSAKLG